MLERYGLLDTLKRRGDDALRDRARYINCFGRYEGGNVLDFVIAMEELGWGIANAA